MSETLTETQDIVLTTKEAIKGLERVTALISNPVTDQDRIPALKDASDLYLSKLI